MKKVFSLLLVLCMILSAVPTLADEVMEDNGTFIYVREGDAFVIKGLVMGLNDREWLGNASGDMLIKPYEVLHVPSKIDGVPVELSKEAFAGNDEYKKIVFEEGISYIPQGLCRSMINLIEVTLPSTVVEIGDYAFADCIKLEKINIPEGLNEIGEGAFEGCSDIVRYTAYETPTYTVVNTKNGKLPIAIADKEENPDENFDYVKVNNAIAITKYKGDGEWVVIPDTINGLNVTNIRARAFCDYVNGEYQRKKLKKVVIGENVNEIESEAFYMCDIEELIFLNADTKLNTQHVEYTWSMTGKKQYLVYDSFCYTGIGAVYAYKDGKVHDYITERGLNFVEIETFEEKTRYSDVTSDHELYNEVELLSKLGILSGYDDGEFKLDETLTRAEAMAIMVRLLNKENETKPGETVFSDVEESHWASGYINIAVEMGIINGFGDGTFHPEEKVTYHQFIKMLCCVLGYDLVAEARGGWENEGYLQVADIMRLTKGIEHEKNAPVKRGVVAELIYNALEIEMLDRDRFATGADDGGIIETDDDQEKNIITVYFDYQVVVGKMETATSLKVTKTYNKNQGYYKKGDCITFKTEFEDLEELVGKTVAAYVKKTENGENLLLVAAERAGT